MNGDTDSIFTNLCGLIDIDESLFRDGIIKFHAPTDKVGNGNRFSIEPNFRIPGLCPDRPAAADGRVSFHLGHSVVVKHATYQVGGSTVPDHAVVVSADGRTISTNAAKFDGYISRDSAVLVVKSMDGDDVRALFTNIHPDDEERRKFWNAVTKTERRPSRDVVTLYPERLSQEKWSEIVENYSGPPELMWGLLRVQADLFTRVMPLPRGKNGAVSLYMPRGDFDRLRRYLKRIGSWDWQYPAAEIKRGLGGRIQRRLVAELPTGITPAAMLRIAQKFAQYLADKQVMYTVVVHAPNAHNDERNFHIHAVIYDRPSEFLTEHGCWDFEYCVPVKGYRNRVQYPLRKNKIASLSRPSPGEDYRQYAVDMIMKLRETYADMCNQELIDCGSKRLFDHRSYEEMGILQKPIRRLSRREMLLSAAGVPTAKDTENAEKSWQGAFDRALEDHLLLQEHRRGLRARVLKAIAAARDSGLSSAALQQIECHLDRFDSLLDEIEPREWPIKMLYLGYLMAISRADKTSEMCQRLIDSIDAGVAKSSDRTWEDEIRDRYKAAMDHYEHVTQSVFGSIQAADIERQLDELGHLESEMGSLIETVMDETHIAHMSTESWVPSATKPTSIEPTSSPDEASRREPDAGQLSDLEEGWERKPNELETDDLEADAASRRDDSCRVAGFSEEEQALLRDAALAERSQQRLEARERQESRSAQDEPIAAQAMDANSTAPDASNDGAEASGLVADATITQPVQPCRYDEALKRRNAQMVDDEVLRKETAQIWFKEFQEYFRGKPLPIFFDGNDPIIDIARLPKHLVVTAEGLPGHVNPLIRPFVDEMREVARQAILGAPQPLIKFKNGQAEYDPMDFWPEIRAERNWLLDLDPVVHRYARQAMQRAQTRAVTPSSPVVQGQAPQPPGAIVSKGAAPAPTNATPSNTIGVQTQAAYLNLRKGMGR